MTDAPPIPAAIWRRLLAFLSEGRTGSLTLDVHLGKVKGIQIKERIRAEEHPRTRGDMVNSV
jgi:FixJ family two-component response regulator